MISEGERKGTYAVELRTLRYFLAAAQEGNITRAADILHIRTDLDGRWPVFPTAG